MANTKQQSAVRETDILIIGGGIAGLWLLNRLRNEGYDALLLEQNHLGGGQTIASQGMVHGGIKYALGGQLTGSSEAIAAMPERWRSCLRGEGDVDLRQVTVLSNDFHLWSTGSLASKLTGFLASKTLRGRIELLKRQEQPAVFQTERFTGNVYRLFDPVLDTYSLVEELAAHCPSAIYQIDWQHSCFVFDAQGAVTGVKIHCPKQQAVADKVTDESTAIVISASRIILAAGEGNEELLVRLGVKSQAMQRRPLHQVLLKSPTLTPLFAHCLGHNTSPRLTISSHLCRDGQWVWYLGGDLATEGVKRDTESQIDYAQRELAAVLPWVELQGAQWASHTINRAEPRQTTLLKPDNAFARPVAEHPNVIVTWPTKLTLAPDLSDQILALLTAAGSRPKGHPLPEIPISLPRPAIAEPLWEQLFQ